VRDLEIIKLSDEFGQYTLVLTCGSCLRERRTTPHLLAKLCGWDARLEDVARRMRCSICGKKQCTARAVPLTAPRGYKSTREREGRSDGCNVAAEGFGVRHPFGCR